MSAPDFVVVGHAVRDLVPGGWRLGGTVTFAAVQAHRLGLSVGIVTRAAGDLDLGVTLPFAEIACGKSVSTTSFLNVYAEGHRTQRVPEQAQPLDRNDLPAPWRDARIALLGPVLGELEAGSGEWFASESLVGVSAQGWLRAIDAQRRVVPAQSCGDPFWRGCDVLFVSDEDLVEGVGDMDRWLREVPVVAMTESWKGARVHESGSWRRIEAFPEEEVDPTGAGDTFATAFLVRLSETGDAGEATRFGAAAASLSVGGIAAESIPTRAEVESRLREYPEIVLR
jgi:sugar/nucleoside kinase (ribokinase family)